MQVKCRTKIDVPLVFREAECNNTLYLKETTQGEIKETIKTININSSAGFDSISVTDLIVVCELLLLILTRLINNLFVTGEFPDILTIGKVTLLFKSGDITKVQSQLCVRCQKLQNL